MCNNIPNAPHMVHWTDDSDLLQIWIKVSMVLVVYDGRYSNKQSKMVKFNSRTVSAFV